MKPFDAKFTEIDSFIENDRKPDFNNLLSVLKRQVPARPTLFEFFMNGNLYENLTYKIEYDDNDVNNENDEDNNQFNKLVVDAFRIAGYDYATMHGSDFRFITNRHKEEGKSSISLNEGCVISDRESFEKYDWPDPDKHDYSLLEKMGDYLPDGMKIIVYGPNGVLETVFDLVGYENLCYMIVDEPGLVQDIFDAVGSRFVRYYELCAQYDTVGALISNDDWGFNTQPFLSVEDMRKYVIPWHRKIVETIHAAGKPAIMHSCGMLDLVMDDIIDDIKYDGKHSYEDNIRPVEEAYKKFGDRIAILGGIDVDFICRSTPEEVYNRAVAMLEQTRTSGGYALGSGNSIPGYVPQQNYLAMIAADTFNETY
jgi:uroporphyrinogen decarboxylase